MKRLWQLINARFIFDLVCGYQPIGDTASSGVYDVLSRSGSFLWLRSSQSGWPICTACDADSASDLASAGTGHLGNLLDFTWFNFARNPY